MKHEKELLSKKVTLRDGGGNITRFVTILPISRCGQVRYRHSGEKIHKIVSPECTGCPKVESPGGRYRDLICLNPRHYGGQRVTLEFLTRAERESLVEQLQSESEWELYLAEASVHGAWKVKLNQGVVVAIQVEYPKRSGV